MLMPFVHILLKTNPWSDLPSGNMTMILARGATGLTTTFCVLWSIKMIPISINMIVINLHPFWTGILGLLMNGEPFGKIDLFAMLICFAGIAGITLTAAPTPENDANYSYLSGVLLALFASFCIASINVIGRRIRKIHWSVVLTHLSVQYLVVCTMIALIDNNKGTFLVYQDSRVYLWAVIGGLTEICFIMCHIIALQNAIGVFVALLGYQSVAYGFLADIIIFKTEVTGL